MFVYKHKLLYYLLRNLNKLSKNIDFVLSINPLLHFGYISVRIAKISIKKKGQ